MAEQRVNILVYRPDGTLVAQYLLGDGEHLIGRDINCPVYLDSEHISFNHAKLHLSHDGIHIEDLNSTAGTYLDRVTVRGKLRIKPGQVLQVGDLTIHLQPESEEQAGPGSRLGDGRYTLVRMLGKGGMGEVWLAKDEQLDEEVALKRLPPEVGADAMALADMQREVKKSRALSHPNIVRIHDLVMQTGEDPLISLEYVDGTDLTAIAATKTNRIFGWSDIKDWILQLVTALEYAHEEKIVHRDLKPGNIMISRKGRLKLADFGISATVADATRRSSMEGFISGTTLYMSPQQMEGKPPKVTDDVYALGATIYELLTSRPPFYTGNVEHQVINVTPAPPSQRLAEFGFTGEIPPYVQELAMACLSKEPEDRPQTMGAVRQWIEAEGQATGAIPKPTTKTIKIAAPVAAALGPAAEPVPEGEKAKSAISAWAIYVMGIVLVLVCFIVGKNCSGGKESEAIKEDKNGSAMVGSAVIPAEVEKPKGKSDSSTGPDSPTVTQPVQPPTTPATGTKKPGTLLWEFETGDWVTSSPAIGTDGTVYIRSMDGKLYALDGKTGTKKWEAKMNGSEQAQASPSIGFDGTVYIGGGGSNRNTLYALDGKTGESLWRFETGNQGTVTPAIGSDGVVYLGSMDNKIYALNGATGTLKWSYRVEHHVTAPPAIGTDGTVYFGSWDRKVYALNGKSGKEIWEFAAGAQVSYPIAIGIDGTLFFGQRSGKVYALNGRTGVKKWEFKTQGNNVSASPAIGKDGTVYVGSNDKRVYALDGKNGTKKWEFETGGIVGSSPAIGADGTVYIGSSDSKVYALDGVTGTKKWEFETGRDVQSSPAISSDGILYIGSKDNKVYAIKTDSKGLAKSPWPMFGQNAQHTGRASAISNSLEAAAAIEAAIRKAAGKPSGELTKADLLKVKSLEIMHSQVKDVTPLSGLSELRSITLRNNKITDLNPLKNLSHLRHLDLQDNLISDLSGLENMKQLVHLNLHNNKIRDLAPLSELTELNSVWSSKNQITNIRALAKLTKITSFGPGGFQDNPLTDLKGLEGMTELQDLQLHNTRVKDLTPLFNLKKLKNIQLTHVPDVTKSQIEELQKALPNCKIAHNATK